MPYFSEEEGTKRGSFRSAIREREKYIEDKTGASHLLQFEFCYIYAKEGTRHKGSAVFCSIRIE